MRVVRQRISWGEGNSTQISMQKLGCLEATLVELETKELGAKVTLNQLPEETPLGPPIVG